MKIFLRQCRKASSSSSHHILLQQFSISALLLLLLLCQSVVTAQSTEKNWDEEDGSVEEGSGGGVSEQSSGQQVSQENSRFEEEDSESQRNRQEPLGSRSSWFSFKGDQDSGLNFHALITKRGFRLIEYSVDTADGYQLALHRVVPIAGYSESNYTVGRKPILLAHDLIGSSANWFVNSPELLPKGMGGGGGGENGTANGTDASGSAGGAGTEASAGGDSGGDSGGAGGNSTGPVCGDNLGFCLILSGKWDVWALNFRGNAYSRRSKNFSTWNPSFWAFSQDEFAAYDLPANLRYIQDITGQKKVAFVGHEVSAAAMLALLSEHTEFTPDNVDPLVLIAPSVYLANARSLLSILQPYGAVALAAFPHEFQLQKLLTLMGLSACKGEATLFSGGCKGAIEKIFGETNHFNATRFATVTQFWPTSTSMDVIAHLAQHYLSNDFKHYKKTFSWSSSGDAKAGQPYPLEQIHPKMRMLIMTGPTDAFVDPRDSHRLVGRLHLVLPNMITYEVQNETWNHLDFVFGEDAGPLVYDPLLYYLDNGELGPYKPANNSRWVADANSTGGELVVLTTEMPNVTTPLAGAGGGIQDMKVGEVLNSAGSWLWG